MLMCPLSHRCKRHRFRAEIMAHAVWLYFHFPLSLRHGEDLLAERGIEVSFQTVAEWAAKCGREYAVWGGRQPSHLNNRAENSHRLT